MSTYEARHRPFTQNISVRNVNDALEHALRYLPYNSEASGSRAGRVMVSHTPVITCYANPCERVLFSPMRDANPFFHFMESLWMLAGRDDVAYPVLFNSTFGQFSDDGERFWGAYGFRWRKWFGYDQLNLIIEELKRDPTSRRCVLSMWSPGYIVFPDSDTTVNMVQPDLMQALGGGKDVPCNTNVFFRVVDDSLDMMVNCRSNDVFWGAYGANAVHFSFLLEYLASAIGCKVGRYWQNSFNFHAYVDKFPEDKFNAYSNDARAHNLYETEQLKPFPLMVGPREDWDLDLCVFMRWSEVVGMGDDTMAIPQFDEPFFNDVAVPMRLAWMNHKQKDYASADSLCNLIAAEDWRAACKAWITRRWQRHARKVDGNDQ
jgi:hypothetical protein